MEAEACGLRRREEEDVAALRVLTASAGSERRTFDTRGVLACSSSMGGLRRNVVHSIWSERRRRCRRTRRSVAVGASRVMMN